MSSAADRGQAAPALDRCPRCGGGFHCGVNDATPCPCSTITLDAATQAALRTRYQGCLCLRCLQALSEEAARPSA
jgi:hypothetical protein